MQDDVAESRAAVPRCPTLHQIQLMHLNSVAMFLTYSILALPSYSLFSKLFFFFFFFFFP